MVGILTLSWLLALEIGLYVWANREQGKGWKDWVWERDHVAGSVFFAMLAGFAVLPTVVG